MLSRDHKFWATRLVMVGLAIYAGVSVTAGIRNALKPHNSQDLLPVYKSARLWWIGQDPYAAYDNAAWQRITHTPPLPEAPIIIAYSTPYPPFALLNLFYSGFTGWETVRLVWLILNLVLALLVPLLIRRLWYPDWSVSQVLGLGALWMAGIGLRVSLGNGQHTVFWLACTLGGLICYQAGRSFTACLAWAASLHKVHMAPVFLATMFLKRQWRAVVGTCLASLAILAVFLWGLNVPASQVLASYLREIRWWADRVEGGGLYGLGATHFYPVLILLFGRSLVAQLLN